MVETPVARPRGPIKRRLVTAGRVLGTGATAFFVMIALLGGFESLTDEIAILSVLFALASAAIVVSWWSVSGAILLYAAGGAALFAFSAYEAHHNEWIVGAMIGGPYIVSALVMLLGTNRCDWTGQR